MSTTGSVDTEEKKSFNTNMRDLLLGYSDLQNAIDDCEHTSQVEALARMLSNESVFLSGISGAGKSFVVSKFVSIMREYFARSGESAEESANKVVVLGATGIAAVNVGGMTVHSFTGLNLCNEPIDPKLYYNTTYRKNVGLSASPRFAETMIKKAEVVIVDEVSMLSGVFIDNMSLVMQKARGNNEPFGGATMVFVGDFMQLPPVSRGKEEVPMAFESDAWKELDPTLLFLSKPQRSTDKRLTKVLDDMRNVQLTSDTKKYLAECKVSARKDNGMTDEDIQHYVRLFTTNKNVDNYNAKRLSQLSGKEHTYTAKVNPKYAIRFGSPNSNKSDKVLEREKERALKHVTNGFAEVSLKPGAVVIVNSNLAGSSVSLVSRAEEYKEDDVSYSPYIVNGDSGVVQSCDDYSATVKINRTGDVVRIFPITQEVEFGAPYYISNTAPFHVQQPKHGKNGNMDKISLVQDTFQVTSMPLRLGFAVTVHKSQGQTLHGVVVDLTKCFTPGLGYVALSRVANLDSLVVEKIGKSAFAVDKKCVEMSKKVEEEAKKNRDFFEKHQQEFDTLLTVPELTLQLFW